MVGLDAGVDDECSCAAPMLKLGGTAYAIDVVGGVGAGEGGPEKVVEFGGHEVGVVADDDEGEAVGPVGGLKVGAQLVHLLGGSVVLGEGGSGDGDNAGEDHFGVFEALWEVGHAAWKGGVEGAADGASGCDDDFGTFVEACA